MRENIRQIIIAPHITEKTGKLNRKVDENSYVFKVSLRANKIELKKAIENIFSVKVKNVNTIYQKGKPKTMGRFKGKRADWKKAIITLQKGDSIPDFDV
mmetsp:Transcript_5177/g.2933  ORF Transcript_5177/g.2933 Transcript_5177/m.2933 type:complete len:99 (+) Transcript_5177:208-504(+)